MTRQYELVYVVSPDATEEQVQALHAQIAEIVGRMGATIEKTEHWGRRRLAYEIGSHKEGTYVLELIAGDGELMKELDRRLRVNDLVIRHLVVRIDQEQKAVDQARARRRATTTRRRVARGLPPERQPGEGPRSEEPSEERGREKAEVRS